MKGFTGIELVIVLAIFAIIGLVVIGQIDEYRCLGQIEHMGYNKTDVKVFLETIGAKRRDFIESESLQKQYEQFKHGELSDYMRQSIAKRKADDESASGMATGLALGMAMQSGGR